RELDRRVLSRKQPGDQHDMAVGKLKRVVMRKRPLHVDLTETSQALAHEPEPQAWHQAIKGMFVLDLRFERDLSARKKAHCHVRLANCGEPTSARAAESARYQLIPDHGGSRRDLMKAVVAHGKTSS